MKKRELKIIGKYETNIFNLNKEKEKEKQKHTDLDFKNYLDKNKYYSYINSKK